MKVQGVKAHPTDDEFADIFHFQQWLIVLSSPRILEAMRQVPTREHLLCMIDAYLPYARSNRQLTDMSVPDSWRPDPELREARALELRATIEQWTGPTISKEVIQAARALLHEDSVDKSDEAWDTYIVDLEPPPENFLVWPEMPEFPRNRKPQG